MHAESTRTTKADGAHEPPSHGPVLTIAVPTWNRASSLRSLLRVLVPQVRALGDGRVEILVGDNASEDHTTDVCREHATVRTIRHPVSVGFDGNVWSLYRHAAGRFVLFFSDDDVPLPDLVSSVVQVLENVDPDVLLIGFEQPLGNARMPSLGIGPDQEVLHDPAAAIDAIIRYTKLSTYCVRRSPLTEEERQSLEAKIGTSYFFVTLALFVGLARSDAICALHRPTLAGSGPDFNVGFRFPLDVAANFAIAVDVPGYREHASRSALAALHTDRLAVLLNNLRRHYLGILTFTAEAVTAAEAQRARMDRSAATPVQLARFVQYLNARYVRPLWVARMLDAAIDRAGSAALQIYRRVSGSNPWPAGIRQSRE